MIDLHSDRGDSLSKLHGSRRRLQADAFWHRKKTISRVYQGILRQCGLYQFGSLFESAKARRTNSLANNDVQVRRLHFLRRWLARNIVRRLLQDIF